MDINRLLRTPIPEKQGDKGLHARQGDQHQSGSNATSEERLRKNMRFLTSVPDSPAQQAGSSTRDAQPHIPGNEHMWDDRTKPRIPNPYADRSASSPLPDYPSSLPETTFSPPSPPDKERATAKQIEQQQEHPSSQHANSLIHDSDSSMHSSDDDEDHTGDISVQLRPARWDTPLPASTSDNGEGRVVNAQPMQVEQPSDVPPHPEQPISAERLAELHDIAKRCIDIKDRTKVPDAIKQLQWTTPEAQKITSFFWDANREKKLTKKQYNNLRGMIYAKTAAGKKAQAKADKKYQNTPAGKLSQAGAQIKYRTTGAGKAIQKKYEATDAGKSTRVKVEENLTNNQIQQIPGVTIHKDFGIHPQEPTQASGSSHDEFSSNFK